MQSSLRLSGPVMTTENETLGAASPEEEAMQPGRSTLQSIPFHFNLNPRALMGLTLRPQNMELWN